MAMRTLVLTLTVALLAGSVGTFQAAGQDVDQKDLALAEGDEQQPLLSRQAGLRITAAPLPLALLRLAEKSRTSIAFSPSSLPRTPVTCDCKDVTLSDALTHLLAGSGFTHRVLEDQIVIAPTPNRTPLPVTPAPRYAGVLTSASSEPSEATADRQVATAVAGEVVGESDQRPIVGAQVRAVGTALGALTDGQGRFRIEGLPDQAEIQLEVDMIGFRTARRTVRTGDLNVRIELQVSALALDAIVVTGTAGQARRREVGNSIVQIDVGQIAEPVGTVDQALAGRAAGVSVLRGGGAAGAGAQIRLRGTVSVSMSNQPIVYIDGVRAGSDSYPLNNPSTGGPRSAGETASPLNDINPSDIVRIEVIKGAAATTLYGTEAAAGVIQIFTKRGVEGSPTWTLQTDHGLDWVQAFGPPERPYMGIDPWLRNAYGNRSALSVRGGASGVLYYMSAGYEDRNGVLPNDNENRITLRGNLSMHPTDKLELNWHTAISSHRYSNTPAGTNFHGLTTNVYRAPRGPIGSGEKEVIDQILDYELHNRNNRVTTGLTALFNPLPNLTNRFVVGFDRAALEMEGVRPFGFPMLPVGAVSAKQWTRQNVSFDYAGTLRLSLSEDLASSLSWGLQTISTTESMLEGYGEGFPGPGEYTVSGAAQRLSWGDELRVVNGGVFIQNLFDFKFRYFATLGLRVDGNSAFGEDFGLQPYPKASFSYVLSEEAFWPDSWGELKLRAAYGHAGRAPGAFDALRTWQPESYAGVSAFVPLNQGNPNLGPERTVEIEAGLDGSFFDGRLALEATYYHQTTKDALFPVRQTPSQGFTGSQLENVGRLSNRGAEIAVDGTIIERGDFGWSVGGRFSTNHSEIIDLGGVSEFGVGQNAYIIEGQPILVLRGTLIKNPNAIAEPELERDHLFGPNHPTHTIGVNTDIRLPWGGVRLTGHGEYMGGHYMWDDASRRMVISAQNWPLCTNAWQQMEQGRTETLTARERALCGPDATQDMFIYPADYFRIRSVGLSLPVERLIPRATSATFAVALQNFWAWKNEDFLAMDPEMTGPEGMDQQVRYITEAVPPPARATLSLRVDF